MPEYTPNLNLFKPGTGDNLVIEDTLRDNFVAIDDKLGSALKDVNGQVWTTLKARLDDAQTKYNTTKADVDTLKKRSVNVLLNDSYFRAIALRGVLNNAPENTLIGYRMAADMGFWGIFADAQRSSDGEWMMIQDPTVDRTTTGTGTVSLMTKTALQALDAGTKFNTRFAGVTIPTLREFLELCSTHNIVPFINVVGTYTDVQMKTLSDLLVEWRMEQDAVIVSSTLLNLQRVRLYNTVIALGYNVNAHSNQVLDDTAALGNAFAIYPSNESTAINSTNMATARSKGVPIVAMMEPSNGGNTRIRQMAKYGVNGYISDRFMTSRGL